MLAVAQLEMAGDEVRVEVGQEHVGDPAAERVRVLDVLLDVALRIDDHGRAARLVGDQIARVRETPEVVLLEDHRCPGRYAAWRCGGVCSPAKRSPAAASGSLIHSEARLGARLGVA